MELKQEMAAMNQQYALRLNCTVMELKLNF